jgi:hypothetical protein
MKRKLKQCWSIIPPIRTNEKLISPVSLNTKKNTTYYVGNSHTNMGRNFPKTPIFCEFRDTVER